MLGCSTSARKRRSASAAAIASSSPRVEQALEHHPAVGDVAVPGQVDPAHAAVGQAADDLVLARRRGRRLRASARTRSGRRSCGRSPRCARARRRASARRALRSARRSGAPRRPPGSRARRCPGRDTASAGSRPGRRRGACGRPCVGCRSGAPMSCRCARAACSMAAFGAEAGAPLAAAGPLVRGCSRRGAGRCGDRPAPGRHAADVAVAVDDSTAAVGLLAGHRTISGLGRLDRPA